jgi:hypothetical protein
MKTYIVPPGKSSIINVSKIHKLKLKKKELLLRPPFPILVADVVVD